MRVLLAQALESVGLLLLSFLLILLLEDAFAEEVVDVVVGREGASS